VTGGATALARGNGKMLDKLTVEMFTECLGSPFRMHAGPGTVLEVELIEATALPPITARVGGPPRRAPFSLLFRGPITPWVPQGIYRLENEKRGALEFFLVPIGPDEKGMRYEAIFN
jgi:hypothetical protein